MYCYNNVYTLILFFSPIALIHLAYATTEGDYARENQFGFQAAILDTGLYVCTGSIISKYFIVTAAHCFKRGRNSSLINIEVGNTEVSCENVKNVSHIIIHPRYYETTRDFDLALLRLTEELPLLDRPNLQRVNMASDTYPYEGDAITFGWHPTVDATPETTLKLRYANLNVWNRKQCNSFHIWGPHAHYVFGPLVSERMVCAGVPDGPPGTCDFDDGGPLLINGHELLGILSWRFDCLSDAKPSVYISIPLMKPWISRVLANFDI